MVGMRSYSWTHNPTLLALSLTLFWSHAGATFHSSYIDSSNRRYSAGRTAFALRIDLKNEEAVSELKESELYSKREKSIANPEGNEKLAIGNMNDSDVINSRVKRLHNRLEANTNFNGGNRQIQQDEGIGWMSASIRDSKKFKKIIKDQSNVQRNKMNKAGEVNSSVFESDNRNKERFERFRLMLISSAIITTILATACLLISIWIVSFQRLSINRRLILLNEKINALEARLGTRQLPEALLMKMCQMVGANYENIKKERQRAAQDIANDERMLLNESVNADSEAQYDTMHEIKNDIFGNKADKLIANAIQEYENIPKKIPDDDGNIQNKGNSGEPIQKKSSDEGYECYGGDAPPLALDLKKPLKGGSLPNDAADIRPDPTQDEHVENNVVMKRKPATFMAMANADELPLRKADEMGADGNRNLEIRAPPIGAMVDVNDPNYATLQGLDNNRIFTTKKDANREAIQNEGNAGNNMNLEIRPPAVAAMADVNDPNYETLHGIDNNKVFTVKNKS